MQRRLLGVFTAVAAALLLVGVAWASGDAARDDSSSSTVASARSDISTSATLAATLTSTSDDDVQSPGTTMDDHDSIIDDDDTTNTTLDDHDGTVDDDDTTNTTIDDRDGTVDDDDEDESKEESRSVAPVDSEAKSYTVGAAGSVTAQIVAGRLVLVDVSVNTGWTFEIDKSGSDDIEVEFRNGEAEASFEAKLRDGEIRIEIEQKSD